MVAITKKNEKMSNDKKDWSPGSYGYDVEFFAGKNIGTIELKDPDSDAAILVVPGYQGRVMTSTASGYEGASYGWINYKLSKRAITNSHYKS